MPFTLSHAAIMLPFRKYGSMTALICGSLVPDFEGFFSAGLKKSFGHSVPGAFLLDLPLGLFACFLFHLIIRNVLIDNLPSFIRERFLKYKTFNWVSYFRQQPVLVLLSMIVGIGSHLTWDALTHENVMPGETTMYLLYGTLFSIYDIGQYLSSFFGLLLICCYVLKQPREKSVSDSISLIFWIIVFEVMGVFSQVIVILYEPPVNIVTISNTILGGMAIGLLIASATYMKKVSDPVTQ